MIMLESSMLMMNIEKYCNKIFPIPPLASPEYLLYRDGLFLLTVVPLIDGSNAFSCTRLSPFPHF